MSDAMELVSWLLDRRLTVFAGAGVSVVAPSCLPSWWELNHAVIDAVARVGAPAASGAREIADAVKQKQDDGRMPPEYTSEVIADLLGEDYFEVLRTVEGERTNLVHNWLAALGRAGRLPAIVTTNFDTLIERAFDAVGAPLRVLVHPEDYEALDVRALVEDPAAPTVLLKLHGTATEPATAIDTLAQRKRGFAEPVAQAVRNLLGLTRWCVLGYSGADLEAEPNYLFLRQMAARVTPGVDWLVAPGRQPLPAVVEVVDGYGRERGRWRQGLLPGWLEGWRPALDGTGIEPAPAIMVDEAQVREQGRRALVQAVEAWATALGPGPCGLVLVTLAERLHPVLGERAAADVLAWLEQHSPGTRHHGVGLMYRARQHQQASRSAEAAQHYFQAIERFQEVGAPEAVASVLNEYSHVLSHVGQLDDAATALRQSIEITEEVEGAAQTIIPTIHLADVLAHQGSVEEAVDLAERQIGRARALGDEPARALALEHTARLLRDTGRLDDALEHLVDAEAVRRRLGHDAGLAYNLTHQATIQTHRAAYDFATVLLDEAEQLARRLGHLGLRATVQMTRAGVCSSLGDYPAAIRQLRGAAELRHSAGDLLGQLEVRGNLVGMLAARGEHTVAIAEGLGALEQAKQLAVPGREADIAGNLGMAYEMGGDLDAAVRYGTRSAEVARALGDHRTEANAIGNLGNVYYRRGELDAAADAYGRTIALARELEDHGVVVRTLASLGNIHQQRGQANEALEHYQQALSVAAEHGQEGITSHVHLNLGFARMGRNEWAEAAEDLARAQAGFELQGDSANGGQAALFAGQCLAQVGQVAQALSEVERALTLWEGSGHERLTEAQSWRAHLVAALAAGSTPPE